jgi:hypothetical protein
MASSRIGVRWTLGDVSERGFEALRLSIWGASRLFGRNAAYAICVNTIALGVAKEKADPLPIAVEWHDATGEIPGFLRECFDGGMAEGCGWKLAPLRVFPDRFEISLDNDVILWSMPAAMREWLDEAEPDRCLMAEDVRACFG